ncbi:hypothetical protein [Bradyrhizobium canariense]|uniref:Dihydroxyacetone kinase, N-terminal domain n=1 Tax=Bradyrhizobium canariense TaxID=255045 RepID=A0A1H1SBZ0_9BRAD|nr:dihydroxyacetone kinase, N-terminal domain [Bradyrhizobium canariense]
MKKLINRVDTVLEESLDGLAVAHADILLLGVERKFMRRRTLKPGKVVMDQLSLLSEVGIAAVG